MSSRNEGAWLGRHKIPDLVEDRYAAYLGHPQVAYGTPGIRDRVRIDGHSEVFFVVYVDVRRRTVDLVCGERVGFLSNIPFSAIRPAAERQT